MPWPRADRTSRVCLTLLCLVAPPTPRGVGCAADRAGHPLLGEHRTTVERDGPVLLYVQQNDLDIEVQVRQGSRAVLHNAPGGRNGVEWIFLTSHERVQFELCFYAVAGQAVDRSYTISRVELAGAPASRRDALRTMSDAGILWAQGTQSSRIKAIDAYQRVAATSQTELGLADHARLYLQLARMERYQYREALTDLEPLANDAQ